MGDWKTTVGSECEVNRGDELCDTMARISAKNVIIHDSFKKSDEKRTAYDIALIELNRDPKFSKFIRPIRLAGADRCRVDVVGEVWRTTGFGELVFLDFYNFLNSFNSFKNY